MERYVWGRGPMDAEICVVGEAPGRREVEQGLPFVGPSGQLQDKWIRDAGLDPGRIRFENVVPYMPPGNGEIWNVDAGELVQWQEDCLARLDDLGNVKVVVPTGNIALSTLIGVTPAQAKITQRRGSVYLWTQANGRQVKVIPVIHPAHVLREEGERAAEDQGQQQKKNYEMRCRLDWQKVKRELTCADPVPPARDLRVQPPLDHWEGMVRMLLSTSQRLAFDIETNPEAGKILCISFAGDPWWAVSVPWSAGYKPGIQALLESTIPKITQNGHYDCLPGDAEVLTPQGWCRLNRLPAGVRNGALRIAQWEPTYGVIEWVEPQAVICKPYEGELLTIETRALSLACTPTHRVATMDHEEEHAVDLEGKACCIPTSGMLAAEGYNVPWIRLLVAIQADGCITDSGRATFNLKKQRKVERLHALCAELGVKLRELQRKPDGERSFVVNGLYGRLAFGLIGKDKLWGSWLLQLSRATREAFLDELPRWDGTNNNRYFTQHKSNAEWVATIAHVTMQAATIGKRGDIYTVNMRKRTKHRITQERWGRRKFQGTHVYCVAVPSSYFLVRYRDRIHVTGNCYWLVQEGYTINAWHHDTMAKSCLLWPGEPHSLAYLASILTREPWYKGGDEDTGEKAWRGVETNLDKWRALLEYNARDAAVTWEVDMREDEELTRRGWEHVYQEQYQALFQPMLKVMLHGINVDKEELSHAFRTALGEAGSALAQAQDAAGRELFTFDTQVQEACWKVATGTWDRADPEVAKKLKRSKGDEAKYCAAVEAKGVSTKILADVLYKDMGLPVQRKRTTKSVTTEEAALLKLRHRYKDTGKFPQAVQLIENVLEYRGHKKQSEFLDPGRLDADGRFRASYGFRPTTGRLSSSSNPRGTGGNAQNIDRDLRSPFKPDAGCLLLEVDLSQAEARDVYCLTRDRQLIELAHTRPSTFDVHTFMASEVLGFGPWDTSTPEGKRHKSDDRYLSKRIVHATHYDMHENKGSEICMKDGYDISPRLFKAKQDRYRAFAPGLELWQQRTRMEGLRDRKLTNAWGRTIEFPYDRPGDDWYRKLYAWRPQADIARHLNYAWICLDNWLTLTGKESKVNLQLHDALLVSVLPEESYSVMNALVSFCETPHDYYGEELCIPAEIKIGLAWGQGREFKELPPPDKWDAAIEELLETAHG